MADTGTRRNFTALGFDEKTHLPKTSVITPQGLVPQAEFNPAAQDQQKQLLAKQMGLDLEHYQQFALNPLKFQQDFGKFIDPATKKFNIPGVIAGGLIGAPQGPNGTVLAAGSTPTNPLDLASVKSSAVTPGSVTFLPPYLGGSAPQTVAPPAKFPTTPGTFIAPPVIPPPTGTPTKMNRPNAGLRGPLALPQYLRNRQKIAYG